VPAVLACLTEIQAGLIIVFMQDPHGYGIPSVPAVRLKNRVLLCLMVLIVAGTFAFVCVFSASPRPVSGWTISFNATDWDWDGGQTFRSFGNTQRIATEYHLGPFRLESVRDCSVYLPFGTNEVMVGIPVYDPESRKKLGKVAAIDPRHKFPDKTIKPGVLLKSGSGELAWLPRTEFNNLLEHQPVFMGSR
jgi:hypothetical protein